MPRENGDQQRIGGALSEPTLTVREAVRAYLADRAAEGQNTAEAAQQFEAHILPTWGSRRIADLAAPELKAWRDELTTTAPRVRHSKCAADGVRFAAVDLGNAEVRRRRRSTVNRITTTFKAALNYAARMYPTECPNREAWRVGLKAFRNVETPRDRWLEVEEVIRLLNGCRPDFRQLVKAALYTGCRYGELCRAKIKHYNAQIKALRIPVSKSGKWRDVFLHDEGVEFFEELTNGRQPDEWLLTRTDPALVALREAFAALAEWSDQSTQRAIEKVATAVGLKPGTVAQRLRLAVQASTATRVLLGRQKTLQRIDQALQAPWGPTHQVRRIAAACKLAKISPPISFHGLRHTHASLAVQSGMALIALARNLGHADTRMVEKHYGHLSDQYMREQVRSFAPAFGPEYGGGETKQAGPQPLGSSKSTAKT